MNEDRIEQSMPEPGEWLFRVFAYAATTLIVGALISTVGLVVLLATGPSETLAVVISIAVAVACWVLLVAYPLVDRGQTVGMKLFGLRMIGASGSRLGWGQVLLREIVQYVCVVLVVGLIGLIWILFDSEQRTVFDKWFSTRVVQAKPVIRYVAEFREFRSERTESASP